MKVRSKFKDLFYVGLVGENNVRKKLSEFNDEDIKQLAKDNFNFANKYFEGVNLPKENVKDNQPNIKLEDFGKPKQGEKA